MMQMRSREVITNMVMHTRSRKRPRVGDLFYIEMVTGQFVMGRVVRTDARVFADENLLLYFYHPAQQSPDLIRPPIKPELLIAPRATNWQGWLKGYYTTIGNYSLAPEELLLQHCFEKHFANPGHYYDEYGNELDRRYEPCARWGLDSYRTIDDELSEALGIPLAPEDQS